MKRRLAAFVGLLMLTPACAFAISMRPTAATGLMQQPTSQYYHWIYGGMVDVGPTPNLSLRGSYFERPAFHNAGFVDQEFLAFMQGGGSITQKSIFDIYGFIGGGRVWGYIKDEASVDGLTPMRRETFAMSALALTMEAGLSFAYMDLRLGHSQILCMGTSEQIKNKVAWPYSTYYVTATLPIEFGPGGRRSGK